MKTDPPIRRTKVREAVTRIFQAYPRPLSLAELVEYVRLSQPETAYSTVFRLVEKLEREGKVSRIDWRERGSRFEWAALPHHHHIVCQVCGRVVDLDCQLFNFQEGEVEKASGFSVRRHSIEFEGICPTCLARGQGAGA